MVYAARPAADPVPGAAHVGAVQPQRHRGREGLQDEARQVSRDWWTAGHVTTLLISDWWTAGHLTTLLLSDWSPTLTSDWSARARPPAAITGAAPAGRAAWTCCSKKVKVM